MGPSDFFLDHVYVVQNGELGWELAEIDEGIWRLRYFDYEQGKRVHGAEVTISEDALPFLHTAIGEIVAKKAK